MTKHEYIAMSVLHGLKCHCMGVNYNIDDDCTPPITLDIVGVNKDFVEVLKTGDCCTESYYLSDVFPILRHPSDLTKKISQKDYNDGKPFVPIVELAKIAGYDSCLNILKPKNNEYVVLSNEGHFRFCYNSKEQWFGVQIGIMHQPIVKNQLQLFQQLIKWHFDLITEDCEKVYVTDDFNPYKYYETD